MTVHNFGHLPWRSDGLRFPHQLAASSLRLSARASCEKAPLDKCLCTLPLSVKSAPSKIIPPAASPRYWGSLSYLFPAHARDVSASSVSVVGARGVSGTGASARGGEREKGGGPSTGGSLLPAACAGSALFPGGSVPADCPGGCPFFSCFAHCSTDWPFNDLPRSGGAKAADEEGRLLEQGKERKGLSRPPGGSALRQWLAAGSAAGAASQDLLHFFLWSPLPALGFQRLEPDF